MHFCFEFHDFFPLTFNFTSLLSTRLETQLSNCLLFWFVFYWGDARSSAHGSPSALCSKITPGMHRGPCEVLGINPRSEYYLLFSL